MDSTSRASLSTTAATAAASTGATAAIIDEKFSAIDFLKEFSRFPEQEYDLEFADKLFRRLVVSQDFTSLKDQEFLFVLSGLHTFIERVICSKQRMISLEDACFKLIMSYKDFSGKTFFTDKTMQNIFTGFVIYLTSLCAERLADVFEEPFLRPHIMVPAVSDLMKRQKAAKDLRFFTNPKSVVRVHKKKIEKCMAEVIKYLEKNLSIIDKYMERHKEADLLFQMQVITLFKRLLTYEAHKVATWIVHFCPRFVKNLGQDIDYNIFVARCVTKLIKIAHSKPELFELVSTGCADLFKLIVKKFTWKSKYTFVSYDDKQNHEIEINPELFCVFVTCAYSCCTLPKVGADYLSLVNTRLEKLNNEALMKMLTDNDCSLVEFLIRNLSFVTSKTFQPTVGRLLPMSPNEAHKEFLISTSWSSQLIIDLLIGEETRFLEYFVKFLKYHESQCNLVKLTNQSCCFASHFDELLKKLTRMNGKSLIPYNADPLLNRLSKVLKVCMKNSDCVAVTFDSSCSQWSEIGDMTCVPPSQSESSSKVNAMRGDNFLADGELRDFGGVKEEPPLAVSTMSVSGTVANMSNSTLTLASEYPSKQMPFHYSGQQEHHDNAMSSLASLPSTSITGGPSI